MTIWGKQSGSRRTRTEAHKEPCTQYYSTYQDDFVESKNQDKRLPEGYQWLHTNLCYRAVSRLLYTIAALVGFFWSICVLQTRLVNKKAFKVCKGSGFFLYGNHTQVLGDVFTPARYIAPRRLFAVVSAANLGIPVLGRILPMLGALPVPETRKDMEKFLAAMKQHLKEKRCIVIYPEAHVWPYCSFIRPFPVTSFRFPVMYHAPSFCMTTVYHKRRFGKKPKTTVYIDGPFYPKEDIGQKEAQKLLCEEIYGCMKKRAEQGTYEYIRYEEKKEPASSEKQEERETLRNGD